MAGTQQPLKLILQFHENLLVDLSGYEQASKRSASVTTEWNKWNGDEIVTVIAVHQYIHAHQQGILTG